nr:DUF1707 domain-containing protein [Micromonospora sp. DSM 115978]
MTDEESDRVASPGQAPAPQSTSHPQPTSQPPTQPPTPPSPSPPRPELELRVSDAERQAVVDRLRQASGEGRITLPEFDERVRAAYAAATYAQLEPLTADLPRAPGGPVSLGQG